jgi:hypothetical protein
MPAADVNARTIAWAGAAIALAVGLAVAGVFLLLRHWDMPAGADRVRLPYDVVIDGAALQSAPQVDLARYRAEKQRLLDSTGWVDARHGIVRIPIADAMEILAHRAAAAASEPRRPQ